MLKPSPLRRAAEELGIQFAEIPLLRGPGKSWVCPKSGRFSNVEEAVLARFQIDGWRGYSGEGGLLLNLIKAMSFPTVHARNRATFIEALYAQNVAFEEDRFTAAELLAQVARADRHRVERNFDIMASREAITIQYEGFSSTSSTSMLDYFPGLERWMFVELLDVAGKHLMYRIASKFAEAPYEYRKGWPDLTMWKDGALSFVEVKAPGDRLHNSQRLISKEFARPLRLNFSLACVVEV